MAKKYRLPVPKLFILGGAWVQLNPLAFIDNQAGRVTSRATLITQTRVKLRDVTVRAGDPLKAKLPVAGSRLTRKDEDAGARGG